MLYLSIDIGTSSVKLAVLDAERVELAAASEPYPYIMSPGSKVEMDPERVLAAMAAAAARLDPDLRQGVDCVCYDTYSPSLVLMDRSGNLVYPNIITHMDRRSRAQSERIRRVLGEDRFLQITGLAPFVGGCGLINLLWIQDNSPDCLARVRQVGHLAGFIHHQMTGEWVTDLVNASMLGAYRTTDQGGWSHEVLEAFDLKADWFGPIGLPGAELGRLTRAMADRLGLRQGLAVAIGTNDMAAAQVGAGNWVGGRIMETSGSSDMVSILTDVPKPDPSYYLRNSAFPGTWQIYGTTAGGFALDWFHQQFAREMSAEEFFGPYLDSVLRDQAAPGAVGFEPYLTGDRQSLTQKTGSWHGLTLAASREDMLAAMIRSGARALAKIIAKAGELVELDSTIRVSGGLTSQALLEFKAREFGPFAFQRVDNCSVKGNVRLAQMVAGLI
ncbi:MAG: hypothetical protein LBD70_07675 [Bifidobacteriaceae bacterium]|jgi:sugar (pentulose or hexulose) kinase|nr:hypothetical protein [Bifidobacteriaceae bacterium]